MNTTIARLAAQALFGRRRGLVLLVIPVALLALALVVRLLSEPAQGYRPVIDGLGFTLMLPLVALLATSAVIGPEVDDGSIVHILAKPVDRHVVAFSKYVVAVLATWVCGALPLLAAGLVMAPDRLSTATGWLVGGLAASVAYCALFLALSATTRHGVILGMLYVFFWEGALGGLLNGIGWVSIRDWGERIAATAGPVSSSTPPGTTYAVVALTVVTLAGLWWAGDRLRSFTLKGET